jgi:hydroxymethylpyrimidine/phosphomethylpyrimidine kinase
MSAFPGAHRLQQHAWHRLHSSAAIAAALALGRPLAEAIAEAKAHVTAAIREGFAAGRGVGQLRHFVGDW